MSEILLLENIMAKAMLGTTIVENLDMIAGLYTSRFVH